MNPFHESDLELLRQDFPLRNVDRMAEDCAEKHAKKPFHNPLAMLRKWLQTAEAKDTDRLDDPTAEIETPAGMFRADGSWDPAGHGEAAMHRLVDMLVTARRRGYTPAQIADRILEDQTTEAAFPNASGWLKAQDWWHCPAATPAEQCVKDAGAGPAPKTPGERSDPDYAAYRFGLIRLTLSGATTADIAERLELARELFPNVPLDAEIAAYQAAATWHDVQPFA